MTKARTAIAQQQRSLDRGCQPFNFTFILPSDAQHGAARRSTTGSMQLTHRGASSKLRYRSAGPRGAADTRAAWQRFRAGSDVQACSAAACFRILIDAWISRGLSRFHRRAAAVLLATNVHPA